MKQVTSLKKTDAGTTLMARFRNQAKTAPALVVAAKNLNAAAENNDHH